MSSVFGYAGKFGYQSDPDTGLKLLGHRYYDSDTGRFLTRDPIKDGRNWYSYCGNNPVSFFDADGNAAMAIAPFILTGPAGWIALGIIVAIVALTILVAAISDYVYYAESDSGREQTIVSAEASDSESGAVSGSESNSHSGGGAGGSTDGLWEDGTVMETPPPGWVKANPEKEDSNYVHPDYPGVSINPDFDHGPPDGPHWDFHFRKKQFPNMPRKIKVPIGDKWPGIKLR